MDEYEVSYTFTYPQDVVYEIYRLVEQTYSVVDEYYEIVDEKSTRSRIRDNGKIESIRKQVLDVVRLVVPSGNALIPLIKRHAIETVYEQVAEKIKRLCKTRVFGEKGDRLEIKFEHVYFEFNEGDLLDPLVAHKQMNLYNLLTERPINITNNSHLGSDEILAVCRVEIEFENTVPNMQDLSAIANFVLSIESQLQIKACPFLPHTTMFNDIFYRQFAEERIMLVDNVSDIIWWAVKLDGVRGRGYLVNGRKLYLQLDDMRQFSGLLKLNSDDPHFMLNNDPNEKSFLNIKRNIEPKNSTNFLNINQIVALQVEYVYPNFYITDILGVYKYTYDNKTQFDLSPLYPTTVMDSINFMNRFKHQSFGFCNTQVYVQQFSTDRATLRSNTIATDGYIGILNDGSLIKIKHCKTYEMKCLDRNKFVCSSGTYKTHGEYKTGAIYEVTITREGFVEVIKERPDRLIPN
ncbi:lef-4 [Hyphantria cunea granulovirus]|uniref:Lef-4 n=1 Tax=Hyphantria cunea granulovirus TaxID=307448 RepID=A0AAE6D037_9BBAC|nr:lef-4 [Hyphantria cunea granulovirus]QBQ01637.1 lef-4 [Hyphantria cunea granulovirus]